MEETLEELVTKHTRRELEEIAVKLHIQNLGGTKAQLAESIIEARRTLQPTMPTVTQPTVIAPAEARAPTDKPAEKPVDKAKEAPKAKPSTEPEIGTEGVMAMHRSMEKAAGEFRRAGKALREEGVIEMAKGVGELKRATEMLESENRKAVSKIRTGVRQIRLSTDKMSGVFVASGKKIRDDGAKDLAIGLKKFSGNLNQQIMENSEASAKIKSGAAEIRTNADMLSKDMQIAVGLIHQAGRKIRADGEKAQAARVKQFRSGLVQQIRENRDAVSRMHTGSGEISSSMIAMSKDFRKAGRKMREDGARVLYSGIKQFRTSVDSQIKDNQAASSRMHAAAMDLQARSASYQQEIQRYIDQDLKSYVKDFYYG